jgi:hypothetical protein
VLLGRVGDEARKLKSYEKAGDTLKKVVSELQVEIDHQRAEIARLKADTAAIAQAAARGFRQGYHAAASRFSGIVYELTRMTVPSGAYGPPWPSPTEAAAEPSCSCLIFNNNQPPRRLKHWFAGV